jgi:cytochrome P450
MSNKAAVNMVLTPDDGYEIVTGYREAEEILRRGNDFAAQGGRGAEAVEFVRDTLIDLDGDAHFELRRLLAHAVSPRNLTAYEATIRNIVGQYVSAQVAAVAAGASESTDLIELLRRIFWHLGATMIGVDGVDDPERLSLLEQIVVPSLEGVTILFSLKDHGEVAEIARENVRRFRVEFYNASRDRRRALLDLAERGEISRSDVPDDVLTLLLESGTYDDETILRQCVVMMGASTSSTVNVTCHALAELEAWLRLHPGDAARLADPAFIASVVNETIRVHRTGSPYLLRRAKRDVVLDTTGRRIPAGAEVALDLRLASQDTSVFGADAGEFDPNRVVGAHRAKGYGLGFGSGPHVCLAKRMIVNEGAASSAPRLIDIVVMSLLEAGVRVDPGLAPLREPHGADRFRHFPVRVGVTVSGGEGA